MKLLGKMRSLDPNIRIYPCFKDEACQEEITSNIPYYILENPLIINYIINVLIIFLI
jgi:hypothetical protein